MHSDITKKDHEHSNHFPVIIVLYNPYNREEDYRGLNSSRDLPRDPDYKG